VKHSTLFGMKVQKICFVYGLKFEGEYTSNLDEPPELKPEDNREYNPLTNIPSVFVGIAF
jgi:hypothetical protein